MRDPVVTHLLPKSKQEVLDSLKDSFGGRKAEITKNFDDQITALKDRQEGDLTGRMLSGTTLASVDTSKIRNLKAQKQVVLP